MAGISFSCKWRRFENFFRYSGWILRCTTRNPKYAECPRLCRVHNIGHSANIIFAECVLKSSRQNNDTWHTAVLPSAVGATLGEQRYLPRASSGHSVLYLFAECLAEGTRQSVLRAPHARKTHPLPPGTLFFAECRDRALGISLLCRVPTQGHSANLVTCRARARYRGRVVTAIIVCRVPNRCTWQTWSRAAHAPVVRPLP